MLDSLAAADLGQPACAEGEEAKKYGTSECNAHERAPKVEVAQSALASEEACSLQDAESGVNRSESHKNRQGCEYSLLCLISHGLSNAGVKRRQSRQP